MEKRLHVVGIGGTLRSSSTSRWALMRALRAARTAGATTELLDLRELDLPFFDPEKSLEDYGPNVARLIGAVRRADALIWSAGAYHGTLAGVTKNALDFFELLADDESPYLHSKPVGLIATAGGSQAAVNAVNALVHVVHALRGIAVPLFAAIPQPWKVFGRDGHLVDESWGKRLDQIGRLVVETSGRFSLPNRPAANGSISDRL